MTFRSITIIALNVISLVTAQAAQSPDDSEVSPPGGAATAALSVQVVPPAASSVDSIDALRTQAGTGPVAGRIEALQRLVEIYEMGTKDIEADPGLATEFRGRANALLNAGASSATPAPKIASTGAVAAAAAAAVPNAAPSLTDQLLLQATTGQTNAIKAEAFFKLGGMYSRGIGVVPSKPLAITFYQNAAGLGHGGAQQALDVLIPKPAAPVAGAAAAAPAAGPPAPTEKPNAVARVEKELERVANRGISIGGKHFKFW